MKMTPTAEVITAQFHVIDRLSKKGAVSREEGQQPIATKADLPPGKVDPKEVKRAAQEINQALASLNDHLQFSVDDATDSTVVKLIDGNTGEVLRQIPAEEILRLRAYYKDHQGLLVNTAV